MTWSHQRLSSIARLRVSNVDKHSRDDEVPVRLCNYVDVYKNETISRELEFMSATATPAQIRNFRLESGDTVFTKDSETADDIGVPAFVGEIDEDLVCGYHLAIASPDRSTVDPKFLFWALSSTSTRSQWEVLASGVTRVGLRSEDMRKLNVPLPGLEEQRRIADFLDTETTRFDNLLAAVQRQATLTQEAVNARLEASASGLGRAVPLKRLLLGPGQYGLNVSAEAYRSDGSRLLRTTDIGTRGRLSQAARPVMVERPTDVRFHLKIGDILVSRAGSVGAALLVDDTMIDMTFAGYLVRLRPGSNAHPGFVADVLQLPSVQSRIQRDAVESTILNFNAERYGALVVPAPETVEEQAALCAEWAGWKDHGEAVETAAARMASLITERRQALITAAVTGQFDVTTAHGGAA